MRVFCYCNSLSTLLCVCASGSAHSRSLPHLYATPSTVRAHHYCSTVPADYTRLHRSGKNAGGEPLFHLIRASHDRSSPRVRLALWQYGRSTIGSSAVCWCWSLGYLGVGGHGGIVGGLDLECGYQCIAKSEPPRPPPIHRSFRDGEDGAEDGDHCKPNHRPLVVATQSRPSIAS